MHSNKSIISANIRPATSVHEMLSHEGEDFLRIAYLTLLGRHPDANGMAHYLARLKSGTRKSAVLFDIYHSTERRGRRQKISGLERLLQIERRRRFPLIGPLVAKLDNAGDKNLIEDHLVEILNHLASMESRLDSTLGEIPHAIRKGLDPQIKEAVKNIFESFDPDAYLAAHPDVKAAGVNPFEHYMRHGWFENRGLSPNEITNVVEDYQEWIRRYDTIDDPCRSALRKRARAFRQQPKISIIMPTYNPKVEWLREAIESVRNQIYENWELCIADDCSKNPDVRGLLESYANKDQRIKIVFRAMNGHISAASNSALATACGEWIALLDHDDVLAEHALYCVVEAINQYPHVCLVYSDEDKLDAYGKRCDPYFKCDWNPDLFYSHNLITHLGSYKKSIIDQISGFREGYEGSQDHDLALRFIEKISPSQIYHIPRILYHWRVHPESTAQAADAKPYAAIAGEKAINEHFQRLGVKARAEYCGYGYRARYAVPEKPPLVSLIIPTRNAHQLVRQCIESIWSKTTYKNYEIILIDNGSDYIESLRYFDELSKLGVRVIRDDRPFNYSALNNAAVEHARGEIIGLINNDIEVIEPGWLCEMVSHALRPDIGAVGAKLLYPNNTIQHAGVVVGVGGVAGHSHKYFDRDSSGYFSRLKIISSYSAVTAACLLVRKSVFYEVGGLDEENLAIAFNDVDFCLRVRDAGYRNIFTPYALLYHHESVSRGAEDTPEKIERFSKEVKYMKNRWGAKLLSDPAYSLNLTLDREDFSMAWPPHVELLGA